MLYQKIRTDLTEAQKRSDSFRVSVLKMMVSEMGYAQVESRGQELSDEEVVRVLKKEVKKRQDSVDLYVKLGHEDRAEEERKEIEVISVYLPVEMGEAEAKAEVDKIVAETSVRGGQLVGILMGKLRGKVDGGLVAKIVKENYS